MLYIGHYIVRPTIQATTVYDVHSRWTENVRQPNDQWRSWSDVMVMMIIIITDTYQPLPVAASGTCFIFLLIV